MSLSFDFTQETYTVSRLIAAVRACLSERLGYVRVLGEISGLARPQSGHVYFSLKDAQAVVRCALFLPLSRRFSQLQNGQQVIVHGQATVYEARGEFQICVDHVEEIGEGQLRRAYEALCARLLQERLFDAARKRPIPRFPRRIGVITSPTGAALRDVLSVLKRRCPHIPVLIYPVLVQGVNAPSQIIAALQQASQQPQACDVLLLVRGGGSLEDLWAFNDEALARAIAASAIPIIAGIGHETDVTIADQVADLRAPTPSIAAERAGPDRVELLVHLEAIKERFYRAMRQRVSLQQQHITNLLQRIRRASPQRRLRDQMQRLDELSGRLLQVAPRLLAWNRQRIAHWMTRLCAQSPISRVRTLSWQLMTLQQRLKVAIQQRLKRSSEQFSLQVNLLNTVSPLATLNRGYALVYRVPAGGLVRQVEGLHSDEEIAVHWVDGWARCRVIEVTVAPRGMAKVRDEENGLA